ncbi:MAG: gamma-glutamyl-gamma-aminobutyrate hydrolase family protein [Clostridia bacterium]|nr:gamma-glutamyl-gamma-aminobutyrate hydrolase family protein [Clostridia bacterium]
MNRPIIGIAGTTNEHGKIDMSPHYLNAVWEAGGVGVLLAYTQDEQKLAEYAEVFDGSLFAGGVDIDPMRYGEQVAFDSVEINPDRDAFEFALYRHVKPTNKPLLGICRGLQLFNVVEGGTLYQHIEGHRQSEPGENRGQKTLVYKDSMLYSLIGESEIMTNTFHHQNIKALAPTLVADAESFDGYLEAVHMPGHPFYLGVQWHPEIYRRDDQSMQKVFKAFVNSFKKA